MGDRRPRRIPINNQTMPKPHINAAPVVIPSSEFRSMVLPL
jgi:hypothetical protein